LATSWIFFQAELRQVRSRQQQLEEKLLAITAACQEGKYHEEVNITSFKVFQLTFY